MRAGSEPQTPISEDCSPPSWRERDWTERISVNPAVCYGKACIRGTRIMVFVILDNVAARVPRAEILAGYPAITSEDIDAALAYAAEMAREGSIDLPNRTHGVKFKIDENLRRRQVR